MEMKVKGFKVHLLPQRQEKALEVGLSYFYSSRYVWVRVGRLALEMPAIQIGRIIPATRREDDER